MSSVTRSQQTISVGAEMNFVCWDFIVKPTVNIMNLEMDENYVSVKIFWLRANALERLSC